MHGMGSGYCRQSQQPQLAPHLGPRTSPAPAPRGHAHPETQPLQPTLRAQGGCSPHWTPTADSPPLRQTGQCLPLQGRSCLSVRQACGSRRRHPLWGVGGGNTCRAFLLSRPPRQPAVKGCARGRRPHLHAAALAPTPCFLTLPCRCSLGIPSSFLSQTDECRHYQKRQV